MSLRFGMATTESLGGSAFHDLKVALESAGAPSIEPLFCDDYESLREAVHLQRADAAWSPPFVARDLARLAAADPVATVLRDGVDHYYSAIVSRAKMTLTQLTQTRFGWVSRMSAAGYLVPRAYLRSVGIAPIFREERFFRTHARLVRALEDGEIDACATYARRIGGRFQVEQLPSAFVLATMGPIPGDVIVVGRWADPGEQAAFSRALKVTRIELTSALGRLMGVTSFGPVQPWALEALVRWFDRPDHTVRPHA